MLPRQPLFVLYTPHKEICACQCVYALPSCLTFNGAQYLGTYLLRATEIRQTINRVSRTQATTTRLHLSIDLRSSR
jgi:hypothetical protein